MGEASRPEREAQSMFLRLGKRVWVQVCVYLRVLFCLYVSLQPREFHAYWSVRACLCGCVGAIVCFPHLRKDNVLHSTGEQSHYRSRNSSLEATALHVAWIDGAGFYAETCCRTHTPPLPVPCSSSLTPTLFQLGKIGKVDKNKQVSRLLRGEAIIAQTPRLIQ